MLNGKTILVTGGTGTFGHAFVEYVLENLNPGKLIVFSRDEFKQSAMREKFPDPRMRFFIGDVRDKDRLVMAFRGVDIVVHAAAMKHVPVGEITPTEFIKTNVYGSQNVVEAALATNVESVVALSTDKAVSPVSLYGATKICAEKLFVAANILSGKDGPRISIVRYGNVACSRGSVIPIFVEKAKQGSIPITDTRMTRFLMQAGEAVILVLDALTMMAGGEIFIPKLESVGIEHLAKLIGGKDCAYPITGIRPGEKLHEWLIAPEETGVVMDYYDGYCIMPDADWYEGARNNEGMNMVEPGLIYNSIDHDNWASDERINAIIETWKSTSGFSA